MVKRVEINPVPAGTAYVDAQMETFGFIAHKIQFNYRSGTNPIKISFNGTTTHLVLDDDGTYPQTWEVEEPHVQFWYMNGAGDEILEVTAFSL